MRRNRQNDLSLSKCMLQTITEGMQENARPSEKGDQGGIVLETEFNPTTKSYVHKSESIIDRKQQGKTHHITLNEN